MIFGGTFDPVHDAHLRIGRQALDALNPVRLLWLPTGNPAYRSPPVASACHRVAMLRLAIADEPRCVIDERELAPGHSGFTVDTLISMREDFGAGARLVLLIGSDQYAKLNTWHRHRDIRMLCTIAVVARPGWAAADGDADVLPFAPLDVSASDIRTRIARGEDVSAMVPAPVLRYIGQHGLYRG